MSAFVNPALVPPGIAGPAAPSGAPAARPADTAPKGPSFADVLHQQSAGVSFSRHAADRLQRRNIDTSPAAMERLQGGIDKAAAKGARDSVVLVDGTAFVVSVRNRTVITAVDSASMRDHVFTNIDSAVIA